MAEIDEQLYKELIDKIKTYHPSDDFSMVEKAYKLAVDAHKEQKRKSGEPYIIHPLKVAYILAELELDMETITAGILHDIIEDTPYTYEDITRLFSEEIAALVDGVTKLGKLSYTTKEEAQAENYRKMFLAMAKDIRVILIKLADRLHNMRTLNYMTPEKQREKAQETLDIYAPLAHRLGISKIRSEMEDLCFKYLNPDAYFDLAAKIQKKKEERDIDVILSEWFSDYYMQKRLSGESRKSFCECSFSIFIHRFHHLKKYFSQNRMKNDLQNPEPYQEPL